MHSGAQEKGERHAALLSLYERTWEEIQRLREFEWKIAMTFITLSGGFIALVCSDGFKPLLTPSLRAWLIAVQACAVVFGVYCLIATHRFLTQQRNIRRTIEGVLAFYDPGVFTQNALLPEEWKGKRVLFRFQTYGLLIPLMLTVLVVQTLTMHLTWVINRGPTVAPVAIPGPSPGAGIPQVPPAGPTAPIVTPPPDVQPIK